MRRPHFLVQKYSGLFEIYGVSARTRGVEPVRTFFGREEEGQFFAILCGRLLWTAHDLLISNQLHNYVIIFIVKPVFL